MKIPYSKVDCRGNESEYVNEVLESGWLTTASKTKSLEKYFEEYIGCKYALAVNSCTSALHLALDAIGVKRNDGVFVPSMTFTASAEVIRYMDADPVILDVDPVTSCLNVETLRDAISKFPEVKTLIAVHFGGMSLDLLGENGILALCKQHGITVVEDAAHALPAKQNGRLVGSFGDIACFSFYANKTMTTGEGGMIVTNNDKFADRIRLMRLHGINKDVWDRFTNSDSSWEYDVVAPGYKYNMPDLNAAVGLAQIERLDEMHLARVKCAERYFKNLGSTSKLQLPASPESLHDHAWHLYPIRLTDDSRITRNELIVKLKEHGIGTSVHYKPLHQLEYYKNTYKLSESEFPVSEQIWRNTISLPIYNLLTLEEVDVISSVLLSLLE